MAETFQIRVREQGKDFAMHKHIAVRYSPSFKAALSHNWKEANEKRISVPNCEPEMCEGWA